VNELVDWATIVVGVLAFIGTLVGAYCSNNKTVALVTYRLQALEKKVEQHNKVVERMLIAENEIKTMKKEIEKVEVEMHDFEYK
jgi:hypothetical protein